MPWQDRLKTTFVAHPLGAQYRSLMQMVRTGGMCAWQISWLSQVNMGAKMLAVALGRRGCLKGQVAPLEQCCVWHDLVVSYSAKPYFGGSCFN